MVSRIPNPDVARRTAMAVVLLAAAVLRSAEAGAATTLVATIPTTGTAYAVALAHGLIYAAEGAEGVGVYGPSASGSYAERFRRPTSAPALDVAMQGDWLYVAQGIAGIEAFWISGSGEPLSMGRGLSLWPVERLAIGEFGLAGAAAYDGIVIFDRTQPWAPALRNRIPVGDRVFGLAARGTRLLAAEGLAGLASYDLSDLAHPAEQWRIRSDQPVVDVAWAGAGAIASRGPNGWDYYAEAGTTLPTATARMSDPAFGLAVSWPMAFVGSATVKAYDLGFSSPANSAGGVDPPGAALRLATNGALLAAACLRDGISLYRIFPWVAPREIARLGGFAFARRVDVEGSRAVVADAGVGVRLVDVSNPAAPQLAGLYRGLDPYDVHFLPGSGGNSIVASDPRIGLATVDMSVPSSPAPTALHQKTSGAARGFRLTGDGALAVIAAFPYGVKLTNPSPGHGELVGIGELFFETNDVALYGARAYAVGPDDLFVYDVSLPSSPVPINRLDLPRGRRINIDPSRARAYVAAGEHGILVFDLRDAANPVLVSRLRTYDARDVEPLGRNLALVAEGPHGMAVVDLTDLPHPRLLFHTTPAPGDLLEDIAVQGNLAYLAYSEAGLVILSLDTLLATQTSAQSWTLFQ